uniref:Methyltransf_11 domain-containing protein n=1 Tax=Steinernema glaseri TaxID=37863 RepID=A0A1I7YR99_9BILA
MNTVRIRVLCQFIAYREDFLLGSMEVASSGYLPSGYGSMEAKLQYREKSYWDKRFSSEVHFEWLADWEKFRHLILPHLRKMDRILHIGCGNSSLSQDIVNCGFPDVTNVDFSEVLIENGRRTQPHMKWLCNDMRTLDSVASGSMDVVIEKASIESLLVAERSQWNPSKQAIDDVDAILGAVQRVLKPGGLFISISFTQPHFRIPAILRRSGWSCTVETFGDFFHYYCYCMRMGAEPDMELLGRFAAVLGDNNNNESENEVTMPEDDSDEWMQRIACDDY